MRKTESYKNLFIIGIVLLTGCLMYIRNLFGFDWSDEGFYYSESYRLLIGDQLFKDLFGATQFGNALIAPIIYIYKLMVGSLDGVILFFRIINNSINIVIALYIFYIFKNTCNRWLLLISMVFVISFTPSSIAAVSYNTLSMQLFLLSALYIASYLYRSNCKYNKIKLILSGVSYGFATQMYPGLVIAIFIIPIYLLYDKSNYNIKESRITRIILWAIGGIIVVAIFVCVLIVNSSLENMVTNFYRLFEVNNPSYSNRNISGAGSIITICIQYMGQIIGVVGKSAYVIAAITIVLLIYSFYPNIRKTAVDAFFVVILAMVFIWQFYWVIKAGNINYINIPLALLGIPIWLLTGHKNSVLNLIYMFGIFESFAIQIGSNNGLGGSSYGLFLSSLSVMLYLAMYYYNKHTVMKKDDKYVASARKAIVCIMCLCVCCSMIYFRVDYVYRDASILKLDSQLESGPGKGIYTTFESKKQYEGICNEIVQYMPDEGTVLFSKLLPFGYLIGELRPSYSTTYRVPIAYEKLEKYYKDYPEKIPTCVFIINEDVGVTNEDNPVNGYLGDILLRGGYEIVELDYLTVYSKTDNL